MLFLSPKNCCFNTKSTPMKTHFLKLFDYDRHANLLLLKKMHEVKTPQKTEQLMAHLLAAQAFWFNRCEKLPAPAFALWPNWKAETFEPIIQENYNSLSGFISQLKPDDFDQPVNYQNTKGEHFCNTLSDILTHLINHGTHHRAQIGQQLKLAGLQHLPLTDYIVYLRNKSL
ncbi:MAG: hypothetical protein EOP42_14800 [Sphingobacteriaceae bacterium]|nr:MAG: hypothetical protein EOP42_14800 [Sphingobacteriaceae bacterium]